MVKQRQICFYILLHASFLVLQYGSGNTNSIMESPMKRGFYSQIQTEKKKILPIVSVYRKYLMLL